MLAASLLLQIDCAATVCGQNYPPSWLTSERPREEIRNRNADKQLALAAQ